MEYVQVTSLWCHHSNVASIWHHDDGIVYVTSWWHHSDVITPMWQRYDIMMMSLSEWHHDDAIIPVWRRYDIMMMWSRPEHFIISFHLTWASAQCQRPRNRASHATTSSRDDVMSDDVTWKYSSPYHRKFRRIDSAAVCPLPKNVDTSSTGGEIYAD